MNTKNDVLRERYIFNADLVGEYDFPMLEPSHADVYGLRPVPFNLAKYEKRPRECVCHFNIDDCNFEQIWNKPGTYIPMLKYFKYVISPDFSVYSGMPKAMQIHQFYRRRAIAYWLWLNDVEIIPSAGWSGEETFSWCFDGLPMNSTLAVSTNGCFFDEGIENYIKGFRYMCDLLKPEEIVCVGRPIETGVDIKITYLDSFSQQLEKKTRKKV